MQDNECNEASVLVNLLEQIANSSQHQKMVALLTAGCASTTEATAKISNYYNITQVNTKQFAYVWDPLYVLALIIDLLHTLLLRAK